MEYKHTAVLSGEVIDGLAIRPDGKYVDGTLGGGGHASLVCDRLSKQGLLIGIDRDHEAIEAAQERLAPYACKKIYSEGNFDGIKRVLRENDIDGIDGALLDLGVSSYQLDNPERGFSYMQDAPLDMRMAGNAPLEEETGPTAYKVVNGYPESALRQIVTAYGEERWAGRISKFIVKARQEKPIETTDELTEIIKAAIPASARRDGPHPSKRTFQAIRIEVNDELGSLERALGDYLDMLLPGGRLAVITFHSLEDRIVKTIFKKREDPCECPPGLPECVCGKVADVKRITKKPITASAEELEENPRSRSAKLRIVEKLEV